MMMLGKRGRHRQAMKRTTSMTEISFDDLSVIAYSHHHQPNLSRRNSADYSSSSSSSTTFLRTCSLCKSRLAPGRDIFMYRGDSAYCSLECRQHQMTQDERAEKCTRKESSSSSSHSTTISSAKVDSIEAV